MADSNILSRLYSLLYHCKLGLNSKSPSKGYLTAVNYRLFIKSQNKLCNNFRFKDPVSQILTSGVVYKFQCVDYALNPIMENVFDIFL